MARGVQGIIDFTVPSGGSSLSVSICKDGAVTDDRRDFGSMKRILTKSISRVENNIGHQCSHVLVV